MKKFTTFETQLGESVVFTDKAKLSLYKKSSNSGISIDILEEIYRRGYKCWNESFGGTADSFAFDRVNSFIAGGFAAQLDEDLLEKRGLWDNIHAKRARIKAGSGERMRKPGSKGAPTDAALKASQNEDADPCWKGYKMVGMKKKGGRSVPNCVAVKESDLEEGRIKDLLKKHSSKIAKAATAANLVTMSMAMDPATHKDPAHAALATATALPGAPGYIATGAHYTVKGLEKVKDYLDKKNKPVKEETVHIIKRVVREATFQGKKVTLNKPMKGDVKKSKVYVDPDGDGKAQKVNFGDPNLSIKKDQPARKKSYCARSGGIKGKTDKTSANYWSRRAWDC